MSKQWLPHLCLLVATPLLMGQAPLRSLLTGQGELGQQQEESPASPEEVAAARRELAERIAALAGRIQEAAAQDDIQLIRGLTGELDALERLDWVFAQQISALQRSRELDLERESTQTQLAAPERGEPLESPPHSLALLDRRRAEIELEERRAEILDDSVKAAKDAVKHAVGAEHKRERERDKLQTAIAAAPDAMAEAVLRQRMRALLAASETGAELTRLRRIELGTERKAKSVHKLRRTLLTQRIAWTRDRLEVGAQEIELSQTLIDKESFDLKGDLNTAKLELSSAERRLQETRQRLETAEGPTTSLVEEVEAAQLAVNRHQRAIAVLNDRLDRVEKAREIWKRRFATLIGDAEAEQLRMWKTETEQWLSDLGRQSRREDARLSELRSTRQSLLSELEKARAVDAPSIVWLTEQDRHLRSTINLYETELTTLDAAGQLGRWFVSDIQTRTARMPWSERLRQMSHRLLDAWQYEIVTIDDNPITVSTILTAILLFLLGYYVARYLSRLLGARLLPRFGLQTGATAALQTLTFYLLFLFFTLVALRMINVPLTVFTVLGGALAIGVGFGSQNIVNNFISGLILLIEQPIKADDLIEVDGTYGKVERIGTRSTRVRTFSNIHIIVPNSTFLEKNVINWTLSDNLVRVEVAVGVAYGSPTREVERLILKALDEHDRIVDHPVPEVFFTEFGDNALAFRSYFWIYLNSQNDRRRIESDVRFRIDKLFREHDITIAFPQRDVHLDTLKPLDVRVVADRPAKPED
ncbi:mechanosensitive ion channel domain-containing protein [Myxococcota bacterium]